MLASDQRIMYLLIVRIEGYLGTVKARLTKSAAKLLGEEDAVGVQSGDEPLGAVHKTAKILPLGGLAPREGDHRHSCLLELFYRLDPLVGGKLAALRHRLACRIAEKTLLIALPAALTVGHRADHKIHSVGGGHIFRVFSDR